MSYDVNLKACRSNQKHKINVVPLCVLCNLLVKGNLTVFANSLWTVLDERRYVRVHQDPLQVLPKTDAQVNTHY